MKLGYARVSTTDQDARMQIAALEEAGVERERIFIDHMSGAKTAKERPGLTEKTAKERPGLAGNNRVDPQIGQLVDGGDDAEGFHGPYVWGTVRKAPR